MGPDVYMLSTKGLRITHLVTYIRFSAPYKCTYLLTLISEAVAVWQLVELEAHTCSHTDYSNNIFPTRKYTSAITYFQF